MLYKQKEAIACVKTVEKAPIIYPAAMVAPGKKDNILKVAPKLAKHRITDLELPMSLEQDGVPTPIHCVLFNFAPEHVGDVTYESSLHVVNTIASAECTLSIKVVQALTTKEIWPATQSREPAMQAPLLKHLTMHIPQHAWHEQLKIIMTKMDAETTHNEETLPAALGCISIQRHLTTEAFRVSGRDGVFINLRGDLDASTAITTCPRKW